jgi:hypothetical protein
MLCYAVLCSILSICEADIDSRLWSAVSIASLKMQVRGVVWCGAWSGGWWVVWCGEDSRMRLCCKLLYVLSVVQ